MSKCNALWRIISVFHRHKATITVSNVVSTVTGSNFKSRASLPYCHHHTKKKKLSKCYRPSQPVFLRHYQKEAITRSLDAIKKGVQAQVISLPTGSGKTVIFSHLIPRVRSPTTDATKTLVLAHRVELLKQAKQKIISCNPHLSVGIDSGDDHLEDLENIDVVVASVQKLGRVENSQHLQRFDPTEFKLIIIDEAHHATASSYQRIISYFCDESSSSYRPHIWGCSATLMRADRVPLAEVFEALSFQVSLEDMIRWGFVSPITVLQVDVTQSNRIERADVDSIVFSTEKEIDPTQAETNNDFDYGYKRNSPLTEGSHELIQHNNIHRMMSTVDQRQARKEDVTINELSAAGVNDEMIEDEISNYFPAPIDHRSLPLVFEKWKTLAQDRKSTLVFVLTLQELRILQYIFRQNGVDARQISSQTRPDLRERILADFSLRKYVCRHPVGFLLFLFYLRMNLFFFSLFTRLISGMIIFQFISYCQLRVYLFV